MNAQFEVTRTTSIAADPARVHALVDDFHEWIAWSPWEDLDPDLRRTYSGPDAGAGARYAWTGNRKAGEGSMEITGSTPERIDIELTFLKPFKATNHVDITLLNRFIMKPSVRPDIRQVTSVPPLVGVSTNSTWVVFRIGFRKASSISMRSGEEPVISIEPSPALRLPRHA